MAKFSPDCMPRPPEITMRAVVSSGRSLLLSSSPAKTTLSVASPPASTVSIAAEPPSAAAGSKVVLRTVITLVSSFDWTVARALPA